ncbi:hypothetical protein ACE3MS_15455 [Paenibacillus dendritiformis]|uniref:hypothetical protein n=1 Tax=Paenibacillus dendritiformis TaxID=130049 RepID=UPI003664FB4E
MDNSELLTECKIALNISLNTTALDGVLLQKLRAVKGFMANAGVSAEDMDSDLATGVITLGVADIWQLEGGEVKFSPVFYTLLSQLAIKSGGGR